MAACVIVLCSVLHLVLHLVSQRECWLAGLHQHIVTDCMTDSITASCAAVVGLVHNTMLSAATCIKLPGRCNVV